MRIGRRYSAAPLALAALLMTGGCVSAIIDSMFKGGGMIGPGDRPSIVASYVEQGPVGSAGGDLSLVDTPAGPAAMLRAADGSGLLLRTHWRDQHGEHFAMYMQIPGAGLGPGYEAVFPADRSKPVSFFQYPAGTYRVVPVQGQGAGRPLPRPSAFFMEAAFVAK